MFVKMDDIWHDPDLTLSETLILTSKNAPNVPVNPCDPEPNEQFKCKMNIVPDSDTLNFSTTATAL